ncbi:MAG: MFS transporter [Gallionellaceae bacterium]|jgi:GPH family glycoside/pentoside/hexuronide:cation symporter
MKTLTNGALISYGLFGLPLALVALPIYVYVPQYYAERFGLTLTLIGSALLIARILDAFIDPAIGVWIDKRRTGDGYQRYILLSIPLLIIGFVALFHPLGIANAQPFIWFLCSLMVVYLGFSLATISYQSWGAALTQERGERSRLSTIREAFGLIGVIIAAALPSFVEIGWLSLVFIVTLLATAFLLLTYSPRPNKPPQSHIKPGGLLSPFRNTKFRWLLAVFILNGIAAAIPATLFLFFTNDRLLLPQYAGLFLVFYFLAAALSMPLWAILARRYGEKRAWLIGMALAIAAFVWAYFLTSGAITGFAIICILSGFALGADLALPPALLAGVIGQANDIGKHEGAYFGIWNWATKMNLALAAGISLPLLEVLGYKTGTTDIQGLHALAIGFALLPCVLKGFAAALLWRAPLCNV